jgi:hypothetical protein
MKLPLMVTTGGDMSGYWAIGRLSIEIRPTNTNTIDITIAVTGLLMNVFAIILIRLWADDKMCTA